jgi:hypothetical protein
MLLCDKRSYLSTIVVNKKNWFSYPTIIGLLSRIEWDEKKFRP